MRPLPATDLILYAIRDMAQIIDGRQSEADQYEWACRAGILVRGGSGRFLLTYHGAMAVRGYIDWVRDGSVADQ